MNRTKANFTLKFDQLRSNGDAVLKFSEKMVDEKQKFNITDLKEKEVLRFSVELTDDSIARNLANNVTNEQMKRFDWEPESFIDDEIKLKFRFETPLLFS